MNHTPATLESLYSVGHWLVTSERHADALSIFRTMLLVDGTDARAWLGLGACHEALGETDKAIALYGLATSACGDRAARCTAARARLLHARGELGDARDAYDRAVEQAETCGDDELATLLSAEVPS